MNSLFRKKLLGLFLATVLVIALLQPVAAFGAEGTGQMTAYDLHTEYSHNPIGIDNSKPRLSWLLESTERAQMQTAYQIIVASEESHLAGNEGDIWDSGKIMSSDSNNVEYKGEALQSGKRYFWKVKVWDNNDHASAWSEPGFWEMGLLAPTDWQAKWIAASTPATVPTSYSIELDFTILNDGAAILFGGPNASNNFFWQFNVKEKAYAQFRPHTNVGGTKLMKEVDISRVIPNDKQLNVAYHLKIEVNGKEIKTYLNNELIDTMKNDNISFGPIGFRQHKDARTNERALFDNIVIKDEHGKELFQANFDDKEAASFEGGQLTEDGKLLVENGTFYQKVESRSSPMMRKEFDIAKPVRKATVYSTALGLYELSLNGTRVGSDYFNPGWTDYNKRLQYQTYDVTDMLLEGGNAVGAMLGDGWYAGNVAHVGPNQYGTELSFLFQLKIEYEDGTSETVMTDSSWHSTTSGPVRYSDILMGETYDARKEMDKWNRSNYDASSWNDVKEVSHFRGKLVAQVGPTVKATEELKPISVKQPRAGTYIFDMGQNMVGWARLKVEGTAGTKVKLRFAEMLNDDGTLYTENLRTAKQTDEYVLKGSGLEQYEPHFTFHGFRYVEVTGYPGEPALDSITGIVVHTDTPKTGTFETSNPMVNQLYSNITWGQRGNFLSVPTDCPQRNERMGWTGDAQVFVRTATYNMEVPGFYEKYMRDVVDAQGANGAFPDVAPNVSGMGNGSNGWGDAGVIIPWTLYLAYNDTSVIKEHYDAMVKWIEFLKTNSNKLIRPAGGYGDWLSVNETTPTDVVNTAYFAYSTNLLSKMAAIIGKTDDAEKYSQLFKDIKAAFNTAFVGLDGQIKGNTQAGYVFALHMELLDGDIKKKAAEHLVKNIKSKNWHLSTGFLGVGYLLPVLTEAGYTEVAYRLLTNDTYPSWGYSIKNGATTIWERWNSYTQENGFGDAGMNSFNHYSLGSVGEWMFRYAAGIEADPEQPGFKHIIIQPTPGGEFSHVNGEYKSIYGLIKSRWEQEGSAFKLNVTIPVNTTATVYIPAVDKASVSEGGQPAEEAAGVKFLRMEGDKAVYSVGSGAYSFASTMADSNLKLESINLSSKATKLQQGEQTQLTLSGSMDNGMEADFTNAEIKYESSNTNVIKVTDNGIAAAVGPGSAEITATVKSGEVVLTSSIRLIVVTGANLALGKKATARETLEISPEWGAAGLTDGNLARKYSSTGSPSQSQENNPLWVEIDLGANQDLNSVVLYPRTDSSTTDSRTASYPIDFLIQVKSDEGDYIEVKRMTGEPNPLMLPQLYTFENQTARYVRLSVNKLGDMASDDIYYRLQLAELEVYNNQAGLPVTGISLDRTSLEMKDGESIEIAATVLPANAANKLVHFESNHENIIITNVHYDEASDTTKATVTATNKGADQVNGVITVTTEDGSKTAELNVTVTAASAERDMAALSGSDTVIAGQGTEWTVGAENVGSNFTALDVIVHYDPQKFEFQTVGESTYLSLDPSVIQSLKPNFEVFGTAVKAELGQIRIIMVTSGQQQAGIDGGNLFRLHGKVKPSALAGNTTISLSDFQVSNNGKGTMMNVSRAVLSMEVLLADKTALNTAIEQAQVLHDAAIEGTQPGQYPTGSKAALHAAINSAIAVKIDPNATVEQVTIALNGLNGAVKVFNESVIPSAPGDRTELNRLIAEAQLKHDRAIEGRKVGKYAAGSKALLLAAINTAKNTGSSQWQIDEAVTILNKALQVFKAKIVTLIEGQTKVTIRDLSIIANFYGVTSKDPNWSEIEKADVIGANVIDIRVLASIAQMILEEWSLE
ncbi:family 78 glycoside hydrolase catalytic domain [Paenibacillus sp. NRS-1760]|uniref:family 78 glycoside hydrolase catalytic domain n=1 Tax=Paenibacillus sp. NRS-1760 TaxID=3233902 RepID=UPI003D2B1A38